jgi:integrase/recombinase XerD
MPTTLSTTVKHIHNKVPNPANSQLIAEFHQFMMHNGTSQRHQNNNLKAIIAYAKFLGSETTFHPISTKEQVPKFLDTKIRPNSEDPDQQWITTWNDYLVRIKHFFRWLHNSRIRLDQSGDFSTSVYFNLFRLFSGPSIISTH